MMENGSRDPLIGRQINKLTVLKRMVTDGAGGVPRYCCACECGAKPILSGDRLRVGIVKSCGHDRPTVAERLDAKTDQNGPIPSHMPHLGPCHVWTGGRQKSGHGRISIHKLDPEYGRPRQEGTHRVAFFIVHGHWPTPEGLHLCDNPPCVKALADEQGPAHIVEGTRADNVADAVSKNRMRYGENSENAKLTHVQALAILSAEGTHTEIASRFGVTQTVVSGIKRGKRWRQSTGLAPTAPVTTEERCATQSTLTEEIVRGILSATGTQEEIAQRFNVARSTVWRIKRGKVWQHVT